jgi:hypothetical protein
MRNWLIFTLILASIPCFAEGDEEFRRRLSQAIEKTDQSAKILRKQISQNQNAPFLPDLYVQLGDLMSQKALTLYYIQMERDSKLETASGKARVEDSLPVVAATKEAIEIYQIVLREFPQYPKRAEVSYKLALSLRSIEETGKFIAIAERIKSEFPQSEEAMRAGLLLGRFHLDSLEYEEAMKHLEPISKGSRVYEKNLARYWMGLCFLGKEKFKDALQIFETVVADKELKEQENPYDLKKDKGQPGKTDLKRQVLIDSVRAFTYVHEKDLDPVEYYSKIAPTEAHFQEVMEKLAVRYVVLKRYGDSVKILRTVSERTAEPQRVINVYREILLLIPLEQRLSIPAGEMGFVLKRFAQWRAYFSVEGKVISDAYWFFEKQVRDVGTRNHDMAKIEKNAPRKTALLDQAADYYRLYQVYFNGSANSVKMAMNLADVHYLQGRFFESGETYLDIFEGRYGKAPNRRALIENAILSLQKDKSETFYQRVRAKGILLRAILSFQQMEPAKRQDTDLEFLRLKIQYEQDFMPGAIQDLYAFLRSRKETKRGRDAAELILDYFNTLNDFKKLEFWADRILALRMADADFVQKVKRIKKQAKERVVEEKIKKTAGFDVFSQGKSYLAAAMSSGDQALRNAVLQEALVKSKNEKDIQTFFDAARLLAGKEANPGKRAEILRSIGQENLKIGKFYSGVEELRTASRLPGLDPKTASSLWEDAVNIALILHDRATLKDLLDDARGAGLPAPLKSRIREQLSDALDAPIEPASGEAEILFRIGLTEEALASLYKARGRLSADFGARVEREARARCGRSIKTPVCQWVRLQDLEAGRAEIIRYLKDAPANLENLESAAGKFMEVAKGYQELEGSEDVHLETAVSVRGREVYLGFHGYLVRVADANQALKADIMGKAQESLASAQVYQQKCQAIQAKAPVPNPAMKYCGVTGEFPAYNAFFAWGKTVRAQAARKDPGDGDSNNLRKSIFSSQDGSDPALKLAAWYLEKKAIHHALAMASYGISQYPSKEADFKAVLGCALVELGHLAEAVFHLGSASDFQGLKSKCADSLKGAR